MTHPSMARRKLSLVVALVCALAFTTAACLDMEAGVAFNQDMTGKASFKMSMDLAPFVAKLMDAMAARSGTPPPPELMATMQTQLATELGSGIVDVEQLKKTLPEGVTLADSSQTFTDMKMVMTFTFGFKDVATLTQIALPQVSRPNMNAVPKTPLKPFEMFVFTDDGKTMTITTKSNAANGDAAPGADAKGKDDAKAAMAQAKAQLDQAGLGSMLEGASVRAAYRFDVSQTVIEQNATRKEGNSYIWEMKLDSITALDKLPEPPTMKLKFNKK
jgi:hypothetical protein